MQGLARWMRDTQDKQGEFAIHKMDFATGNTLPFKSLYYPGEALFSLLRLYEIDQNPDWLNVAA